MFAFSFVAVFFCYCCHWFQSFPIGRHYLVTYNHTKLFPKLLALDTRDTAKQERGYGSVPKSEHELLLML
jgi:hypothetical protein